MTDNIDALLTKNMNLERQNELLTEQFVKTIKDSGDRTEYESGAVRDMKEGKGRCDLLPLLVISDVMCDDVIMQIAEYQMTGDTTVLLNLLNMYEICGEMFPDQMTMFLDVAKHYEEGAKKYGERNWEKGIPDWSYIDSAVRHYFKWCRGDQDEPHDRAFVWNILALLWNAQHKK